MSMQYGNFGNRERWELQIIQGTHFMQAAEMKHLSSERPMPLPTINIHTVCVQGWNRQRMGKLACLLINEFCAFVDNRFSHDRI